MHHIHVQYKGNFRETHSSQIQPKISQQMTIKPRLKPATRKSVSLKSSRCLLNLLKLLLRGSLAAQLLDQLLGYILHLVIQIEPSPQELTHIRVLHVTPDLLGAAAARAVDVHVHGAVAVGAPADAGADADQAGEELDGQQRVAGDRVQLHLGGVVDVEVLDDQLVVDPAEKRVFLVAGLGNMLDEEGGEVLG